MPSRRSEYDNKFEELNDWVRNTESSIVNFISVFAPWLAPLTPAYMTYQHAMGTLHFPPFFAITGAVLVEVLGFSSVSTFLSFWFYNRRNRAESKRAPIEVVIFAFLFYLALIIFSNVLLDTFPSENWAGITVRALFTLQTIPAALIVAVRTQHKDLLSEIAKEKSQRISERAEQVTETQKEEQKVTENLPKDWRKLKPMLTYEQVVQIASMDADAVKKFSRENDIDERTVTNWRTYANQEIQKGKIQ